MKITTVIICLLVCGFAAIAQPFSKAIFYKAYADNSLFSVDNIISMIYDSSFREKEAYMGVLLMRKAGIVGNPMDKLSLFKQGHEKMEHAIQIDPSNAEYRFLRITIQENAPSMLGYNKNLDEDATIVHARYETLPQEVREAIADYSLKSKVLGSLALK